VRAVPRSDGSKGGRPAFDHVFMFKVLILQASHSLSDERTEKHWTSTRRQRDSTTALGDRLRAP